LVESKIIGHTSQVAWWTCDAQGTLELDAVLAARANMPIGRVPENQGRNCMGRSPWSLDLEI